MSRKNVNPGPVTSPATREWMRAMAVALHPFYAVARKGIVAKKLMRKTVHPVSGESCWHLVKVRAVPRVERVRARGGAMVYKIAGMTAIDDQPVGGFFREVGANPDGSKKFAKIRKGPRYRDALTGGEGEPRLRPGREILRKIPAHRAGRAEPQPEGCPVGYEVKVSNAPLRAGEFELAPEHRDAAGRLAVLVAEDASGNPTRIEPRP